ncbi:serine/threonine-protein kinase [Mycolicibacterium phocaicum]|uniref:serine/threonine-protein kinase n=1 Tax=Mycolicibacterium phocaicum TaxID=319706 RepID=UPI0010FDA1F6|nr:serine/threonine-protein kinase [Mycolicibacterium phocaicum]BBZ55864.1 serine/threonine-protein kinase PknK [Mycolicibacterium phocaicum]
MTTATEPKAPDVSEPDETQRGVATGIVAELEGEGFYGAEPVGRGGFGVVYRCRQPSLDRVVAIKVLNADSDDVDLENFEREQRAMGRVSGHPNIVPVLHSGLTFTGRPFIVMPYLGRNTLSAWIRQHGPLAVGEALTVGVRLSGALETAHRAGVLHRDIKPPNVLLSAYGEPQLCDFGIARIAGGREATMNVFVGSPSYTAPELFEGATPTAGVDIYGLAATVFTLIKGEPPFQFQKGENPIAFARRVLAGPVPDLRANGVADAVCTVLEQGLNVDPAQRPATAAEFGELLRAAGVRIGLNIADVPLELPEVEYAGVESSPDTGGRSTGGIGLRTDGSGRSTYPPSSPARFRPPTFSRPSVPRRRILDRLGAGRRPKLVLIHGPAGYGKTVLATQWVEALVRDGVPAAWLTVDADDDNAFWFVAHLIGAVRVVLPELADALQQEFDERPDSALRQVPNLLIEWLHSHKQTLALLIDEWHRVTSADSLDTLAYLLENGCHHLYLIVAGRAGTGLPLGTLGVQGELVEIDASQLRFDLGEARTLLVDRCGLDLPAAVVADLEESTDGWPAALQLASLSLRDGGDAAALVGRLSGSDKVIGDYLTSNVLDSLEPELVEFLSATCITKQICSGLATALTGRPRSREMLEDIERRDLFLRRTDPDGTWFRYANLFADHLRHRLKRDDEDRVVALNRTAAQWFTKHRMYNDAVDHWLAAGDDEQAVDAVEQVSPDLLEQCELMELIGLAAKLPPNLAEERPRLQANLAWANVILRRPAAVADALQLAEDNIDLLGDDEIDDVRCELDLLRVVMAGHADHIDAFTETAAQACVARTDTLAPFVLCRAAYTLSYVALRKFDFDGALRWHRWGHKYRRSIAGPMTVGYGYLIAALAANEQLDVAGAEAHLRHAIRIALSPSGHPTHIAKLAGALLGELLYERGQLDEAQVLLDDAYALGVEGGIVDVMLATYRAGAYAMSARGDTAGAELRLSEGIGHARALGLPRLEAGLVLTHIRVAALSGKEIDSALTRRVMAYGVQDLDESRDLTAEFREDAQIRLLLRDGQPAALASACERARARLDHTDKLQRPRARLQARVQYAQCLAAAGQDEKAQWVLAPALKTCAALGLSRLLIDEGPAVLRVAHDVAVGWETVDVATAAGISDFVHQLEAASLHHAG